MLEDRQLVEPVDDLHRLVGTGVLGRSDGDDGALGGQFHGLRDEKFLHFQGAGPQPLFELFEQDALVQGVLIDHQHALGRLQHQVRVVQLDRLRRRQIRDGRQAAGRGGSRTGLKSRSQVSR